MGPIFRIERRNAAGEWSTVYAGNDRKAAVRAYEKVEREPLAPGEAWRVLDEAGLVEEAAWMPGGAQ